MVFSSLSISFVASAFSFAGTKFDFIDMDSRASILNISNIVKHGL